MSGLNGRIAKLIEVQGPISVAQYMTLALHDPDDGYYASREPFGAKGDFVTAPEISQMFGELLALWCVQVWNDQGRPAGTRLVELGPGLGTLMADALKAWKRVPDFLDQVELVLVESSPRLEAVQRQRLKSAGVRISWRARFDLARSPLLVLANEFFDALPIRQYVKTRRGWCERMVVATEGALALALAPVPTPMAAIPVSRAGAPEGGIYEVCCPGTALSQEIAYEIASHGGGALIVDYGYGKIGFAETLQAVGSHRFACLLAEPGRHDLSAHVDFMALGEAARRGGAVVFGPELQGALLERLGISLRARQLRKSHPSETARLEAARNRLTEPDAMGKLFQAMAIMPPSALPPPGFE
ncbi:MAG: class I SAM-dependent methyltransferase [Rhizomicrobium sp.]